MREVIWFGRGGQGATVAAQILAESAYLEGFKGVTSAPTFGPERRGAPVTASTRISEEPIRMFSQVEMADIAVVLDDTLLTVVDVVARVRKGGTIIINTSCKPEDLAISGGFHVATVDAIGIALKVHLTKEGAPVINTPLLGAFAKATGIVSPENIEKALRARFSATAASQNFEAVQAAFEGTVVLTEDAAGQRDLSPEREIRAREGNTGNKRDDSISAMCKPSVGEGGRTGDWRDLRPIIDHSKCTPSVRKKAACYLCWLYCPEGVVKAGIPIEIDLEYCKGCGICAEECPPGAIAMVREDKFDD